MNKDFELLLNFVGIGDPKNSIWFVGIEEAVEINPDAENYNNIIDRCRHNNIYVEPNEILNDHNKYLSEGKRYTQIYNFMSALVLELFEFDKKDFKDHIDYRNNKLLQKGSRVFLAELYPLGKKSVKENHQHLHKFGIKNYNEYIDIIKKYRYDIVYNYWLKSKPLITICFGKNYWDEFNRLFKLSREQSELILKNKFCFYKYKKIVLTPFFGHGAISYHDIIQLAQIIKEKQIFL